jgi:hypothetical protein
MVEEILNLDLLNYEVYDYDDHYDDYRFIRDKFLGDNHYKYKKFIFENYNPENMHVTLWAELDENGDGDFFIHDYENENYPTGCYT